MARLKDDHLFLRRGSAVAPRRRVRPVLLLLIFVSLGLMLLSRLHHSALAEMRWRVAAWLSPVLQAATVPVEPFREIGRTISTQLDLTSELQRLKTENQKLSNWEWRARQLETKLADLEALAKVVAEQRLEFVTSRVIADSSGVFVRSVMIGSGVNQNVKVGYPVINADGLVGRVVDIGPDTARVLLASDLNSRIPVTVGPNAVRAILAGDNGPNPRLIYIPDGAKIAAGDDIATSGTGGLFPSGLRIGTVTGDPAQPRVALRANLDKLEYLSVLFYEDPAHTLSGDLATDPPKGQARNDVSPAYAPLGRPR
jgi:rod shape-determining protein MreC